VRILVVDDTIAIRQILTLRLLREGFSVLTACRGAEALELIRQQGLANLAIVDSLMPEMNGFALAEALPRRGPIRLSFSPP
jgi:CheY-like chemotaxis protein